NSSPPPPPLDAPMVDLPVASSSSSAQPIAITEAPPAPQTVDDGRSSCGVGIASRDTRKGRTTPRQIALVITEIQGIEQLLAATPKTAPDRPQILRRLAESYVELTCGTPSDVNRTRKARSQAIDRYTLLKNEYPSYPAKDEVLYYLALEYELA